MKLLVLSWWFPYPPDNGSRLRVYNLLKQLSSKHSIHLLTFYQSKEQLMHISDLRGICEHIITVPTREFKPNGMRALMGLFSSRPRSLVDLWSPAMLQAVKQELTDNRPDAILALTMRCAEYVSNVADIPKILDLENADSIYVRRLAEAQDGWLQKFRLNATWVKSMRHERKVTAEFDAILTVSEEDRTELIRTAPKLATRNNVHLVPNGVDLSYLDFVGPPREPYRIISTGALTYNANYDATLLFCREIMPGISERIPQAEFIITGSYDGVDISPFIEAGAKLTGLVPDIRYEVARSAVLVVPLKFGGGTRLKILEAMALGTPIVSTKIGAMGVGAVSGEHLMMADDPEDFAEAVCAVFSDSALAARLSQNGRELVAKQFGWNSIGKKLEDILENERQKCMMSVEGC